MPQREFLRFIRKTLLFLPLALCLGVPLLILFASGEFVSYETVIKAQERRDHLVLFGMAYNDVNGYYKLKSVLDYRPDVIALGNSRVMQFRSTFFNHNVKFFNAGGAVIKTGDFIRFLNLIPQGHEPKVIILGLDQSFFNAQYEKNFPNADFSNPPPQQNMHHIMRMVVEDYLKGKFTLRDIISPKRHRGFGLDAIENNNGFANDGSRYWGKIIENPQSPKTKERFNAALEEIAQGTKRFPYGQDVNQASIEELRQFLSACRERHIYVVGFLPPFIHQAYALMQSMGEKQAYVFKLTPIFSQLFKEFDFSFFDAGDLAFLNASDEEALDGYHGSEKAYLRIFLRMIKNDQQLSRYAKDINLLEQKLAASDNPFLVFKINEF